MVSYFIPRIIIVTNIVYCDPQIVLDLGGGPAHFGHILLDPLALLASWCKLVQVSPGRSLKSAISQGALGLVGQWSPAFLVPGTGFVEDNFSTDWGWGCFGDDSSTLHLLCSLFLLLLHCNI